MKSGNLEEQCHTFRTSKSLQLYIAMLKFRCVNEKSFWPYISAIYFLKFAIAHFIWPPLKLNFNGGQFSAPNRSEAF